MIHFLIPAGAEFAGDYIQLAGIEDRATVMTFEEVLDRDTLPFGAFVYVGINWLGPAMASYLAAVADHVEELTGLAPLNHPTRSLRRYELIRALYDRGMIPYTAYGAWEDFSEVRLPAFLRPREVDSVELQLRHSLREIERDLGQQVVGGRRPEELVIIEFADTTEAGVFEKYASYRVGEQIAATCLDRGTNWALRVNTGDIDLAVLRDEEEYVVNNRHADTVREIFEIARIQFGRIDYSLLDGKVICWEINTYPMMRWPSSMEPLTPELEAARATTERVFAERFSSGFEAVLSDVEAARTRLEGSDLVDAVPLPEFVDLRAAARTELRTRGIGDVAPRPRFALLRKILRPLKPVLKPVASAVLVPLLAWRARRR